MPRSPLTEIYTKVQAHVDQVKALPPDEFNLFLDLLLPEPQEVKVKKTRKKRGLAPSVGAAPKAETQKAEKCFACYEERDHPNHDSTYIKSHPFQPAPSAKKKSGAKGAAQASIPSSETQTEDVSVAAHAASGGD